MNKSEPIADRLAAALTVLHCYLTDECPHSDQIGEDDLAEALDHGQEALADWDRYCLEHALNQQALPLEPAPAPAMPDRPLTCSVCGGAEPCSHDFDRLHADLAAFGATLGSESLCAWQLDDDGVYETSCGGFYGPTEGNVEDNRFRFCPYCGAPIDRLPTPRS
jgi:hypothetical protein